MAVATCPTCRAGFPNVSMPRNYAVESLADSARAAKRTQLLAGSTQSAAGASPGAGGFALGAGTVSLVLSDVLREVSRLAERVADLEGRDTRLSARVTNLEQGLTRAAADTNNGRLMVLDRLAGLESNRLSAAAVVWVAGKIAEEAHAKALAAGSCSRPIARAGKCICGSTKTTCTWVKGTIAYPGNIDGTTGNTFRTRGSEGIRMWRGGCPWSMWPRIRREHVDASNCHVKPFSSRTRCPALLVTAVARGCAAGSGARAPPARP